MVFNAKKVFYAFEIRLITTRLFCHITTNISSRLSQVNIKQISLNIQKLSCIKHHTSWHKCSDSIKLLVKSVCFPGTLGVNNEKVPRIISRSFTTKSFISQYYPTWTLNVSIGRKGTRMIKKR